jgi:hypothetical protein
MVLEASQPCLNSDQIKTAYVNTFSICLRGHIGSKELLSSDLDAVCYRFAPLAALCASAMVGNFHVLKYFLDHHALQGWKEQMKNYTSVVHAKTFYGVFEDPFYAAAVAGQTDILRYLLQTVDWWKRGKILILLAGWPFFAKFIHS